ncbi:MAG: queuosine precursor transporter [Rhizobiales bacterium]|nr:queuosine precursor transporter [Hyphomicrobiales bacterium]
MSGSAKAPRYLDVLAVAFVAVLLASNLVGPAKITEASLPLVGTITFSAAVLYFPLAYVIGDVLTEVYGFARARRVIWLGFAALGFALAMAWLVVALPPAGEWGDQGAYEKVFGTTWRIVLASMLAYAVGELVNSYVLARMKVATAGRHLYARTIGSSMVGQGFDTLIFFPVAFLGSGLIPDELIPAIMLVEYCIKVGIEAALTPVTYVVVGALKSAEGIDHYDTDTDFSPLPTA